MERTLPFTMYEISRIERGAIAILKVRPITVTDIFTARPDEIGFIDADGVKCRGHLRHYYETEAAAIADLEAAA